MKSYNWIEQQEGGFGWAIFEIVTDGQTSQNPIRFHVVQASERENQVRRGDSVGRLNVAGIEYVSRAQTEADARALYAKLTAPSIIVATHDADLTALDGFKISRHYAGEVII